MERSEGAQKYAAAVAIPLFYGARPPRAAPSAFRFNVVLVVLLFLIVNSNLNKLLLFFIRFIFTLTWNIDNTYLINDKKKSLRK